MTVRIGLMAPLSGIVGIYGKEISRAGQIACNEVNASGGVLGHPLELIIEDDQSLPETAVAAAQKLLDRKGCIALIGNLMTNSRIAVAYRVAEPRRVPYLCFSLYEGSVLSRYYFHFAALPNQQINQMIPYMCDHFGSKMYFCGNNYEWPRGSVDCAKRVLLHTGGQVVGEDYYPLGLGVADIQSLLDKVSRSDAQVLVPFFAGLDEVNVLSELARSSLKGRIAVAMTHFDEVMAQHLAPEARSGLYSSNSYFMSVKNAANDNYMAALRALPKVNGLFPCGDGVVTNFGEATYHCVKAFASAAQAAGSLDQERIVDALGHAVTTGPQGTVTMDPRTHHAAVNSYLARCQFDGSFEIIKSFGPIAPIIPEQYSNLQLVSPSDTENLRLQARIISEMNDAVALINASDYRLVYVNPGFERMMGYTRPDALTKSIYDLDVPAEASTADVLQEINQLIFKQGMWCGERLLRRWDGSQIWASITVLPFTHANYGEVWLATIANITDRKLALSELSKAKIQAEQAQKDAETASQAKDHFMAVLSHELRTPLSPVLTGLSLLEDSVQGDVGARSIIDMIRRNIEIEARLIDDLLDLTRISRGIVELHKQKITIESVISRAVVVCQSELLTKGMKFIVDLGPTGQHLLNCDPERLQQVFWNLLKNAIKFTPAGGTIEIRATATEPGWIEVECRDSGIGIAKEALCHIFKPFEQADRSISRQFGGLGLGLAITKALVELHGGSIVAASQGKGAGASFFVRLPAKAPVERSVRMQVMASILPDNDQFKILIVEDHRDSAEMLRMMLTRRGHATTISNSVEQALHAAETQDFDLVISDLGLPDGTGFELMTRLRSHGASMPAIALSGYGQKEDVKKSLAAGFTAHLTKPVSASRLMETVSSVMTA